MDIFETIETIAALKVGDFSVGSILQAIITFVICYLIARFILSLVRKALEKSPMDDTLVKVIYTALKIVLYVLIALIIIDSVGIPITSLVAVFSVVGLAFSLAVQSFLTNCAGGLQILVAKPFAVGDFIEIGTVVGTVHSLGFIYTKVQTTDNKVIYVPNSEISSSKIINYTSEPERRVELFITASYDDTPENVKEAIYTCIRRLSVFLEIPEPFVGINAFQESRIEYVVRAWIHTEDYWNGYFSLQEEIYKEFAQRGIDMAYDHLDVNIISDKTSV